MNRIKNYNAVRYKKFAESLKPQFKKPAQTQSEAPALKVTGATHTETGSEVILTPTDNTLEYTFKWPSENFELSTYAATEYTKTQRDLRRLEKMENKLVQVDKYKTADGQEMVLSVPQRLAHLFETEVDAE